MKQYQLALVLVIAIAALSVAVPLLRRLPLTRRYIPPRMVIDDVPDYAQKIIVAIVALAVVGLLAVWAVIAALVLISRPHP